jgi:hypothetical protein
VGPEPVEATLSQERPPQSHPTTEQSAYYDSSNPRPIEVSAGREQIQESHKHLGALALVHLTHRLR